MNHNWRMAWSWMCLLHLNFLEPNLCQSLLTWLSILLSNYYTGNAMDACVTNLAFSDQRKFSDKAVCVATLTDASNYVDYYLPLCFGLEFRAVISRNHKQNAICVLSACWLYTLMSYSSFYLSLPPSVFFIHTESYKLIMEVHIYLLNVFSRVRVANNQIRLFLWTNEGNISASTDI